MNLEDRNDRLKELSEEVTIVTKEGRRSLWNLISQIGIDKKLVFYNIVQFDNKSAGAQRFEEVEEIKEVGLRFNDGLVLYKISKRIWNLILAETEKIRYRNGILIK